jgi:rhodanese-related sulfurtransferase
VRAEEAKLENDLVENLMADRTSMDLRAASLSSSTAGDLEVEEIAEGATVLDLRSRSAYEIWHVPGALNVDFFYALKTYRSFDRDTTYVLYCEVGQKSAHLAELLTEAGFKAFHIKNGVRHLLKRVPDLDLLGL